MQKQNKSKINNKLKKASKLQEDISRFGYIDGRKVRLLTAEERKIMKVMKSIRQVRRNNYSKITEPVLESPSSIKGASRAPSFGAKLASKKEKEMSAVRVATYKVTDNNSKDDCTLTFTPEMLAEFEKQLCDKKLSNKLDLEIIEESFRDPDGNLPEGIVELYEELIRSQ